MLRQAQALAVCAAVALASLVGCAQRHVLLRDASSSWSAAAGADVRRAKLDLLAEQLRVRGARSELQATLAARLVQVRRARLRLLLGKLEVSQRRALASHAPPRDASGAAGPLAVHSSWHAVAPDGSCPAAVPHWEWRDLLAAALATQPRERAAALAALHASSRLPHSELQQLAGRYAEVLANREFDGLLDVSHPPCGGRRFARLEGDRILSLDCAPHLPARYALDGESQLREYSGPARVEGAEVVLAYCGEEFNLLAHPRLRPELLSRVINFGAGGSGPPPSPPPAAWDRPWDKWQGLREDRWGWRRLEESGPTWPRPEATTARHYNIVGYNSVPNQLPLYCNVLPEHLSQTLPGRCVWEVWRRAGAVSAMVDEVHDNCQSPTSSAVMLSEANLPDHQLWRLFCSPLVKPCCWAQDGFLNPGRRQCVGGGRQLHEVLMGYLEQWLALYAAAPRRWASINTMVAHEHFMLRLPALDDALSTFLERHAAGLLRDTVVMLLSDHGTHGIWYNDYEIGAAEHKLPVLYVLAPDWLMRERPAWQAALRANTRRMVTVRELYHAMVQLAAYPNTASLEAGALSILDPLPEHRTCAEAGVPEEFCACRRVAAQAIA
ncbi:hypothetical protein EMIHUDRAFT_204204 [Emiliania huxleyi CCMP1516]|uniref:Sulfatase N-terminal domain-containing protein n=2 Tax=Emiliania huxleyi TaxID=2903 RepID=A0A0D3JXY0_EMIH1|nr:hypothetical protein EMIHUDRAFT_204204 [Emiliania huxleyi CCMP1516]EOD28365.1 hypothetical protein EMIHUDRAFT_204204 [Emiliania huxleyi CCMP1516]|eukprot:XP_005780794.1 hypothetical protein EMIHUDRAFT_204204 [Emiliania huxleyi CCMP1516]